MDIDFGGKVYLVTGGASGIGAAVVKYLALHHGCAVIADINDEAGDELVAQYPKQLRYLNTDVTQLAQLETACELAETAFGGLDGAVNSAGIGSLGTVADMPMDEWHKVISVDLHGVFHACRAALPLLRKRGGGAIINIASLSGIRADYGFAAYNAAKAGVVAYFIPSSVIKGMLAGIGVIIILKQIPHAFGHDSDPEGDLAFAQPDGETTISAFGAMLGDFEPSAVSFPLERS